MEMSNYKRNLKAGARKFVSRSVRVKSNKNYKFYMKSNRLHFFEWQLKYENEAFKTIVSSFIIFHYILSAGLLLKF
jgi:hypothetical protein